MQDKKKLLENAPETVIIKFSIPPGCQSTVSEGKRSTAYAVFGAKYGSIDTCFQRSDETKPETVPEGSPIIWSINSLKARMGMHSRRFAKTGASANAFYVL